MILDQTDEFLWVWRRSSWRIDFCIGAIYFFNLSEAYQKALLQVVMRFLRVVKLTSVSVAAVQVGIKVFAFFRAIVGGDVQFLLKLVFSVGKRTLWTKFALAYLPVAANLGLELLLKILCGGSILARAHSFDVLGVGQIPLVVCYVVEVLFWSYRFFS